MDDVSIRAVLGALSTASSHRDVEGLLLDGGWQPCGAGDWAVALASADGSVVARISPFDPVGPYTARLYREGAATRMVPRLFAHRRLAGGGDLQLLERLDSVPQPDALEFLAQLAASGPGFEDLAELVNRIHRDARRDLPWCGPLDENPSNIMRAGSGQLVLADPYYADGRSLYAAVATEPDLVVALIPERERRFMTEIPLTCSGPWQPGEAAALREKLRIADLRRK